MSLINKNIPFLCFWLVALCSSCEPARLSYDDFEGYIQNPKNGLVVTHQTNSVIISAIYIPSVYKAYEEYKNMNLNVDNQVLLDSLCRNFAKSKFFLIKISSVDEDVDVMHSNISSTQEVQERYYNLSFSIKEYIHIKMNNEILYPVLTHLENLDGITKSRIIHVVFADDDNMWKNTDNFSLVFEDPFLGTGINQFDFTKNSIKKIPQIKL